jgi:hypothetical protein
MAKVGPGTGTYTSRRLRAHMEMGKVWQKKLLDDTRAGTSNLVAEKPLATFSSPQR